MWEFLFARKDFQISLTIYAYWKTGHQIFWPSQYIAQKFLVFRFFNNKAPYRVEANAVEIQSIKKNPIPFLGSEKNHHEFLVFSSSFQRKMLWFFCCDFEFVKLMKIFYWYVIDNLCNGFQFTISFLKSPQLQKKKHFYRKKNSEI